MAASDAMPARRKISKKLPKRTKNDKLKARRAASWARGQERKRQCQREAEKRRKANDVLRAEGLQTPWEVANGFMPGWRERRRVAVQIRRARAAQSR